VHCLPETITCRPEEDLLVCCASVREDEEHTKAIRSLLQQEIDWAYLFQIADRHGVIPLLYKLLKPTPNAVPKPALDQLRNSFRDNAVRNLFLTAELLRLLQLFGTHEIPAIPFKGPVLASSLHGDVALRQFEDLDILVHKRDVPGARRLLVSEGYHPQFALNARQEAAHLKLRHALSFTRSDGSVLVDLHWAITPARLPLAPDPESLWEGLEPVSILGREVQTFSPEDLLLVLCVHGTKHRWAFLSWIGDVGFLIQRHAAMDWDRVLKRASADGSERMLLLGLFLASELLGAIPPKEISKKLQTRGDLKALADRVYSVLFRNPDIPPRRFDGYTFYMRAMDRFRDRLRFCCLELTPTPLEWALLPLPIYLSPLYYLLRPIRLLGKYALRLGRRLSVRQTPNQ
jgi:hypothetical protein